MHALHICLPDSNRSLTLTMFLSYFIQLLNVLENVFSLSVNTWTNFDYPLPPLSHQRYLSNCSRSVSGHWVHLSKWPMTTKRFSIERNRLKFGYRVRIFLPRVLVQFTLHSLSRQEQFWFQMSKRRIIHCSYIANSYMAFRHKPNLFQSGK